MFHFVSFSRLSHIFLIFFFFLFAFGTGNAQHVCGRLDTCVWSDLSPGEICRAHPQFARHKLWQWEHNNKLARINDPQLLQLLLQLLLLLWRDGRFVLKDFALKGDFESICVTSLETISRMIWLIFYARNYILKLYTQIDRKREKGRMLKFYKYAHCTCMHVHIRVAAVNEGRERERRRRKIMKQKKVDRECRAQWKGRLGSGIRMSRLSTIVPDLVRLVMGERKKVPTESTVLILL